MTRKKPTTDRLAVYRAAPDFDDGADPREFFKKPGNGDRSGRKSHQLCAQVADTLTQIFGGECGDEVLQSLTVLDVTPAPDASQLLVQVRPLSAQVQPMPGDVSTALDRAAGWLRTEVAGAISRKRAPRLVFRYVPAAVASSPTPETPPAAESECSHE